MYTYHVWDETLCMSDFGQKYVSVNILITQLLCAWNHPTWFEYAQLCYLQDAVYFLELNALVLFGIKLHIYYQVAVVPRNIRTGLNLLCCLTLLV